MQNQSRELEYQALRSFLKLASEKSRSSEKVRIAVEDALTPRQLQLVELYYTRQMPMHVIAAELGINVSTVSRTLRRARDRIERCLKYGGRNLSFLIEK